MKHLRLPLSIWIQSLLLKCTAFSCYFSHEENDLIWRLFAKFMVNSCIWWKQHIVIYRSSLSKKLFREVVIRRCSVENVFFQISKTFQENTCARVSCLKKVQAEACNFIKNEAGSGTGVFLRILRNFKECLFYRTPLEGYFWIV